MKLFFGLTFFLFAILMTGGCVVTKLTASRAIDRRLDRAEISADAQIMAVQLTVVLRAMEEWGITSGHTIPYWPTDKNNVALDYEAIQNLRNRAVEVAKDDRTSAAYATNLADMRQTVQRINVDAGTYVQFHTGWLYVALLCYLVCVVLGGWKVVYWLKE